MPWKVTRVVDQRIEFVMRAFHDPGVFSRLCEEFGISRPTGYKWFGRYRQGRSVTTLQDRSRRPRSSPGRTDPGIEDRVVELREQRPDWGAKKLRVLLLREGIDLPVVTINRIIRRNGQINARDSHKPASQSFERSKPNELWQMDFKGPFDAREGRCHPLTILDDYSRFSVGLHALASERAEPVHQAVVRTFEEYGLPEEMLMDHGTPWWSNTNYYGLTYLSVALIKQGIKLRLSGIGHPQTQGKVERFHGSLQKAVLRRGEPATLLKWGEFLTEFREEYNHLRPHEALGMEVPATRYKPSTRTYNLRPSEWEYPTGSDVRRLSIHGCLSWGARYYFVCEALRHERVAIEKLDGTLLVRFRHMYVREIDLRDNQTRPLVIPINQGNV